MATQLEKKVADLIKRGQQPTIVLSPGSRIVTPKRKRGRPRVRTVGDRLSNHVGRRGRRWPTCMAKGCNKYLKVNQQAACSDTCRDWLFNHALTLLQKLGATKAELLDAYDDPVVISTLLTD